MKGRKTWPAFNANNMLLPLKPYWLTWVAVLMFTESAMVPEIGVQL